MYQQKLYVQGDFKQGEIKQAILELAGNEPFESLFAAVAYSTMAGSIALVEGLRSVMQDWPKVRKEWLISIDYGLTEPRALEYLQKLPKSKVRVPDGLELIDRNLRPLKNFHPKVYFFTGKKPGVFGVVSGSANLTLSGLLFNSEQMVSSIWKDPVSARDTKHRQESQTALDELKEAYERADVANVGFLEKYSKAWKKRGATNEDRSSQIRKLLPKTPVIGISKSAAYSVAKSFWVNIEFVVENLGPGNPGNQIDLQRGSRVFFGFSAKDVPRNTSLGSIDIIFGGQTAKCNMRYGNNQMDKLNLPVPRNPGPPTYQNTTLMFTKKGKSNFELDVGTRARSRIWKVISQRQGTFYKMASGREFGVIR